MRKITKNPMTTVMLFFMAVLIGSNVCCTGVASNQEKTTKPESTGQVSGEQTEGVISLTDATFDEQIKTGISLVDFYAAWCRPCRIQAPVIEEVNADMSGKAGICKIDIDKNPVIAERYGIESIPTIIIFKDGKAALQFVGITSKEEIITSLNKLIK